MGFSQRLAAGFTGLSGAGSLGGLNGAGVAAGGAATIGAAGGARITADAAGGGLEILTEGEVEGEGAGEDEQDSHNEALREDDGGEFGFKDGGNCVADDAGVGDVDDFTERREED